MRMNDLVDLRYPSPVNVLPPLHGVRAITFLCL